MYPVGIHPDGTLPSITAGRSAGGGTRTTWGGQHVVWAIKDYQAPCWCGGGSVMVCTPWKSMAEWIRSPTRVMWRQRPCCATTVGRRRGQPRTNWSSSVHIQAPGCFELAVDGVSFREVNVFQAVMNA
jgi:hypothetical protein